MMEKNKNFDDKLIKKSNFYKNKKHFILLFMPLLTAPIVLNSCIYARIFSLSKKCPKTKLKVF